MPTFTEEKAYSLVEVLVAMALLLVIFIVSTQIVMNTMTQSDTINRSFSSMEMADGILNEYQSKPLDELKNQLNTEVEVNIREVLNLDNDENVDPYKARVSIESPGDVSLKNHLLKIIVVVDSGQHQSRLEGYVKQ